jgi:hypothetical protein
VAVAALVKVPALQLQSGPPALPPQSTSQPPEEASSTSQGTQASTVAESYGEVWRKSGQAWQPSPLSPYVPGGQPPLHGETAA